VAKEIGGRLEALEPDLWLIFANDHAEQFFHNVFRLHGACRRQRQRQFRAAVSTGVPGDIGFESSRGFIARVFDPAFTSTAKIDYAMASPDPSVRRDPVLPIS
jgi:2,3-dihydroxyphenylpropionate 1,2-dioxygenase